MGFCMTEPLQERRDPPAKNRVVGSRRSAANRVEQIEPQPLETASETTVTVTVTVSGIPLFLSRDPIGISGGLNEYGFVQNRPVDRVDPFGLADDGELPEDYLIIDEPARTEAVKNNSQVRADVKILINNMLAKRDKTCPEGETKVIRKPFDKTHYDSYAFMYFTGFFLLGQVHVNLDGSGVYQVDCCTKEFKKWNISIDGSFVDKFDELIPVPGPKKGIGSLPVTFQGNWTEYHSGK